MNDQPHPSPEILFTGNSPRLYGRLWQSSVPHHDEKSHPQAVLMMVHGLGDHGGRFSDLAEFLVNRVDRLAVYAFDLPSHGQSPGRPGAVQSYDALLEQIASARRTLVKRFGNVPHILLGHSMGGNLAINYVIRSSKIDPDASPVAAMILAAPMLLPPKPLPRPAIFAAWLTGYLLPFWRFEGNFSMEHLTSDPQQRQRIEEDQAMHSKISMHLATQLVAQGRWAIDHARHVQIPSLIAYGEQDELIDRSACDHVAIRIGNHANVIKLMDTRHALFHDIERHLLFENIVQWIKKIRLTAKPHE